MVDCPKSTLPWSLLVTKLDFHPTPPHTPLDLRRTQWGQRRGTPLFTHPHRSKLFLTCSKTQHILYFVFNPKKSSSYSENRTDSRWWHKRQKKFGEKIVIFWWIKHAAAFQSFCYAMDKRRGCSSGVWGGPVSSQNLHCLCQCWWCVFGCDELELWYTCACVNVFTCAYACVLFKMSMRVSVNSDMCFKISLCESCIVHVHVQTWLQIYSISCGVRRCCRPEKTQP